MQQLQFTVAGQTLTRTDSLRVVADSIGQYEAVFTIDDSWDGYVATAQYTKNGVTYDENIVDGVSEVPAEALIGSGQIHVHVVGNSPDGKRITVNDLLVPIDPSGWRQKSSISAGPVITVWHKVVAMLLLLRGGTAGQFLRKKSADNYDGEWTTLPIDVDAAYRTAAEVDAEVDAAVAGITAELTDKEDTANKVTSVDGDSTDEQYPSAKCLYDTIVGVASYKQNRPLVFTDVTVSEWEEDTTYTGYGYKATIPLTDATADMIPHVYFSGTDALSGNYAPPPESYNGGIYLYGKTDMEITVSVIVLEATS
jgi:hypothetical protein